MSKIKKILIANRAEIALRIQQTCDKLKIPSVVLVSEADKDSFFSRNANKKALIKGFSAKETYLNINKIITLAKKHKCNAIHPGYGFLSENPEFASKVIKSGLIFIGPDPKSILALGDKAKARKAAANCDVPVTPGTGPDLSDIKLIQEAEKIGYPLLIKAVSGGGGRGMRVINNKTELANSLLMARAEAKKNFLDDRVYLEKYINKPRHVEVQIAGDKHGNYIHLGTRDCSTQRRHQKLIEEAPAPYLSEKLRKNLHDAAIKIASFVKYTSVGTAEFLVEGEKFYFLEMNTRIQVEHPITEEITGIDIVKLQIDIARGKEIPIKQKNIKFKGHSIEFRINAENPEDDFKPLTGKITEFAIPQNKNLRVEKGFEEGDEITPYYDGLICKLIINGKNRAQSLKNSAEILNKIKIKGISTTLPFHIWAVTASQFKEKTFDIAFIQREFNPKTLLEIEARKLKDQSHRGNNFTEYIEYKSKKFEYIYKVKNVHLKDGTFLLMPVNKNDKPVKEIFCRRSNSLDAAFDSLTKDVLEAESPKVLFRG